MPDLCQNANISQLSEFSEIETPESGVLKIVL